MLKNPVMFFVAVVIVAVGFAMALSAYRKKTGRESDTAHAVPANETGTGTMTTVLGWESLSDNDLQTVVLRNLNGYPSFNKRYPSSDAALDAGQEWIDDRRAWAQTLTEKRLRHAYLDWMDYFQNGLDENREENRTHAQQKEDQTRREKDQLERERMRDIVIPRPPR